MFQSVLCAGGSQIVTEKKLWAHIGRQDPGFKPSMTDISFKTKKIFCSMLLPLEQAYSKGLLSTDEIEIIVDEVNNVPPAHEIKSCTETDLTKSETRSLPSQTKLDRKIKKIDDGHQNFPSTLELSPLLPRILPRKISLEALAKGKARIGIYLKDLRMFSFATVIGWSQGSQPQNEDPSLHIENDDGELECIDINNESWVSISVLLRREFSVALLETTVFFDVIQCFSHDSMFLYVQVLLNTESYPIKVALLDIQEFDLTNSDLELEMIGGAFCVSTCQDSKQATDYDEIERKMTGNSATSVVDDKMKLVQKRLPISTGPDFVIFDTTSGISGIEIYIDMNGMAVGDFLVQSYRRFLKVSMQGSDSVSQEKFSIALPVSVVPDTAQALLTPKGLLYVRIDRKY